MARLIDDIRANGVEMPNIIDPVNVPRWTRFTERMLDLLAKPIPVILADNVAAYYFEGTNQEHWDIVRDFPNLAPPYDLFWLEHRMPHKIRSTEGDSDLSGYNIRVGMLVFGVPREQVTGEDIPEAAHWLLNFEIFIDYGIRGHGVKGPHGSIQMVVGSDGQLVGAPQMRHYSPVELGEILERYIGWVHPALLTISFLHCKNVTVTDHTVPKPLAKKYEARTGIKPTGYKMLLIEPLRQILRNQGRSDTVGLAKAMHICRGHFRDYRQGKGLFGKYHQMVWTPSTVRGTKGETDATPERVIKVKV